MQSALTGIQGLGKELNVSKGNVTYKGTAKAEDVIAAINKTGRYKASLK